MILSIQADSSVAKAVEAVLAMVHVGCRTAELDEVRECCGYDAILVGADYLEGGPLQALEKINRQRQGLLAAQKPVIYMTEDYDLDRRSEALRRGATAILNWPCSAREMLGCIERVLRQNGTESSYAHLAKFAGKTGLVPA